MSDPLAEIRARDALKSHSCAGVTMTQAEADRRTLLRLLDATREELTAALGRLNAQPAAPTTWISPSGATYDLTKLLIDKDGEAWRHAGWFTNFDGELEPRLTLAAAINTSDPPITDVENDYGPLTQSDTDEEPPR